MLSSQAPRLSHDEAPRTNDCSASNAVCGAKEGTVGSASAMTTIVVVLTACVPSDTDTVTETVSPLANGPGARVSVV